MKHIVLCNEGSRASVYGIGAYIRELIGCLKGSKNISLHLIQLNSDEKECKFVDEDGYYSYYFPHSDIRDVSKFSRYYRNCFYILCAYLQVEESDQIIFHLNYVQEYPVIEYARKKYPNSFVLFTVHYQDWCFSLKGNSSYFKDIIHKKKENITDEKEKEVLLSYEKDKNVYQAVDYIICLSKFTQELLITEYNINKEKTILTYNGLKDEGVFLSQSEKSLLKKQFMLPEDERIILFAGRLDDIKGVEFLVRAFIEVVKKESNCRLILAGDGDYSAYLKEAKDHWGKITFTGRLDKEDLYKFYQIADVGVLPSFHEQCSYVSIEMMMFGIPLIVADTTGATESVIDNETGFILPVLSEDNIQSIDIYLLAEKISLLLNCDLRQNVQTNYLAKYNKHLFREKMLACYDKSIKK